MSDEVLYTDVKFNLHQNQGTGTIVESGPVLHDPSSQEESKVTNKTVTTGNGANTSGGGAKTSGGGANTSEGVDKKSLGVALAYGGRSLRLAMVVLACLCVLLLGLTIALGLLYARAMTQQQSTEALNIQINSNLTAQRDRLLTEHQGCKENLTIVSERLGNCTSEWRSCRRACGPGWKVYNTSCYFFSQVRKTWLESQYACVRAGGHLVIINSWEEQEFVRHAVGNANFDTSYWIGMTDEVHEGLWVWMDNSPVTNKTTFWDSGEPNNKDGDQPENCARIGQKCYNDINCWFDNSCLRQSRWICESQAGCEATC